MGTNYIEMLSEKITHYPVYLDTDTLDMYCEYLLSSDETNVSRSLTC